MNGEKEEYNHLLEKIKGNEVRKKRYYIPLERGYVAELDIYEGQLEGLFATEVEFPTIEEAESFVPPTWLGEDISKDRRYKNTFLARNGRPKEAE